MARAATRRSNRGSKVSRRQAREQQEQSEHSEDERVSNVEEEVVSDAEEVAAEEKSASNKPVARPFDECAREMAEALKEHQASLRAVRTCFTALRRAHKSAGKRGTSRRTPTMMLQQPLVDYITKRLDPDERVVIRTTVEGKQAKKVPVTLSELDTTTKLHMTDLTQLFTALCKKHGMTRSVSSYKTGEFTPGTKVVTDGKGGQRTINVKLDKKTGKRIDGRMVNYSKDRELVRLLTKANRDEDDKDVRDMVDGLKDGSTELMIFNIQKLFKPLYRNEEHGTASA